MNKSFLVFLSFFLVGVVKPCQCPPTALSRAECNKYEVIFRGKVISAKDCDHKFGEGIFEVTELYKGNASSQFKVLFECNGECAKKFYAGEEWIIYSRYKQIDNALMDWCSRSRKHFRADKEDYYFINYGNDYEDELKFLRDSLGLHRLLEKKEVVDGRNRRPNSNEMIIILISSIAAIILFYYLFNRFFK